LSLFTAILIACPLETALAADSSGPAAAACSVEAANYDGWDAERLSNSWVTLVLVPKLGGRLMQVTLGGHDYLFVNPRYRGKYYPPTANGALGDWYNYGGDKLWPLPEGTEDDRQWPGPRSDLLDDGDYKLRVLSEGPTCAVRLEGPADPWTGLQYIRDISIDSDSPHIAFHAVMKNATSHPIEWSMESVSQYDTADPNSPGSYNHNLWAFTPANPHSAYLEGYHVRSGIADPGTFEVRGGLFALHWSYIENELWIDSPGNWLAVADLSSGYGMVERFRVDERASYPGKATVIFYVNGPSLELDEHGMPRMTPADPVQTPYYMEAEVISPMVRLAPGETYAMDTDWYPTRASGDLESVTDGGVAFAPLIAELDSTRLRLTGAFGVFYPGRLIAHVYDSRGAEIATVPLMSVDPRQPVALQQEIPAPSGASRVSVHLEEGNGADRGALGEARVSTAHAHP
jgi:hypothetical protein